MNPVQNHLINAHRYLRYARRPCPFPPGSAAKLRVLAFRAWLKLPLFRAGDAAGPAHRVPA